MDPLALDEAARKMTGRHASSLGPAELAYIIELQQGQIKAKLAVRLPLDMKRQADLLTSGFLPSGEAKGNGEASQEISV